ncbi:ATP synthase subunit delta [Echinococcus granulosus]|uniref:F-ATPase delta subunit n=1 Tax=Echinococcus granulosus TaxID=6210 RepID=W6UAE2_ECHGR|nr:ATP synthase subunit delta [Echinococcus granulosus]EUB57486.1 ATP synthase subunit delta [Echinococcus granulosus]
MVLGSRRFKLRLGMYFIRLIPRVCRPSVSRGISTSSNLCAELYLTFACPRSVFYSNVEVKQVDVPGSSGAFGILPEHVPTIATLRPGVVGVTEKDGGVKKYFVSSGTVTVNADSTVQVLAEECFPLKEIDAQLVRDNLAKAQSQLSLASTEEKKVEAQITIEAYESMLAAL